MKLAFPKNHSISSGFTLMELAISTTIVGLVIGVILIGRDLLTQGELRKITAGLTSYEAALTTFRDQYAALPGDINNATAKWGSAGGNGADETCQKIASTGLLTCNGNGDGILDTSVAAVQQDETNRAWQHLKNAELIDGTFVGTSDAISAAELLTKTLPSAGKTNTGFQFRTESKSILGWVNALETLPILALRVGAPVAATAVAPAQIGANSLSPYALFSIDEKLDDAMPGTGKVYTVVSGHVACISNNDALTATYNAANEEVGCYFHYSLEK